ncbi:hypothetical protein RHSIM_Rhsim04G0244500 [Rhododendron simsii]|uniref:Uncharacterized protein n=1 Tax=Rhododendron simsii TaxID=118357 RepID=A0A834LRY2_RHOSS|nr:hypothetical protein RHSIM_Rhsim04G0244500 [Rhododendron simsii]
MRFNILQLLKNLRSRCQGKEFTDARILNWANKKVNITGRTSHMDSFKDKNLSNGLFFLELLSAVGPRQIERSESSPSLSPSTAASINGEDKSSLIGEVSKLTMDDTAFDTAVSSQVENEITSGASIYRVLSLVQS